MSTFYDPEEEAKIFLTLTILRENKKVLFAEANKDFVDNLLGLMTFPVSSMIPFIPEAFGSLTNVRKSIEKMAKYHNPMKELLLNTKPPAHRYSHENVLFSPEHQPTESESQPVDQPTEIESQPTGQRTEIGSQIADFSSTVNSPFYVCEACAETGDKPFYVAEDPTALCLSCNKPMTQAASYCGTATERANKEGGFVLYESKYIITDDLHVHPLFTVSLMKNIAPGWNSPNAEEITVDVSHKKLVIMGLLKRSMQSNTVLSDLFFSDGLLERVTRTNGDQGGDMGLSTTEQ